MARQIQIFIKGIKRGKQLRDLAKTLADGASSHKSKELDIPKNVTLIRQRPIRWN